MAHTPGPWHAYPADYQRDHEDSLLPIFVVGPEEFHTVCQVRPGCDDDDLPAQTAANASLIAAAPDLLAALKLAVRIADEARDEWDRAPSAMRAGKLLIALSGHLRGYRLDIDGIHAAIVKAEGG